MMVITKIVMPTTARTSDAIFKTYQLFSDILFSLRNPRGPCCRISRTPGDMAARTIIETNMSFQASSTLRLWCRLGSLWCRLGGKVVLDDLQDLPLLIQFDIDLVTFCEPLHDCCARDGERLLLPHFSLDGDLQTSQINFFDCAAHKLDKGGILLGRW